jgi:hypothetical protein
MAVPDRAFDEWGPVVSRRDDRRPPLSRSSAPQANNFNGVHESSRSNASCDGDSRELPLIAVVDPVEKSEGAIGDSEPGKTAAETLSAYEIDAPPVITDAEVQEEALSAQSKAEGPNAQCGESALVDDSSQMSTAGADATDERATAQPRESDDAGPVDAAARSGSAIASGSGSGAAPRRLAVDPIADSHSGTRDDRTARVRHEPAFPNSSNSREWERRGGGRGERGAGRRGPREFGHACDGPFGNDGGRGPIGRGRGPPLFHAHTHGSRGFGPGPGPFEPFDEREFAFHQNNHHGVQQPFANVHALGKLGHPPRGAFGHPPPHHAHGPPFARDGPSPFREGMPGRAFPPRGFEPAPFDDRDARFPPFGPGQRGDSFFGREPNPPPPFHGGGSGNPNAHEGWRENPPSSRPEYHMHEDDWEGLARGRAHGREREMVPGPGSAREREEIHRTREIEQDSGHHQGLDGGQPVRRLEARNASPSPRLRFRSCMARKNIRGD